MTVIIRTAAPADVEALGRLGALLVQVHHDFDRDRFIAPTPQTPSRYGGFLAGQIKRKDAIVLVADEDGAVVGYAYGALEGPDWLTLRGPAGVIYDLMVDPAYRRQGVGRRLLEEAIAALQRLGAPQVMLETAAPNAAAQRLFTSAGFRPTLIEMTRDNDFKGGIG
ncbi:MAG TPA: GNAT family N-acetyltransferase [Caulobacteraceae bacterium]|nr:GNAT family N-acetyltransferase [Caulobacteraceae bacterium]